MMLPQLVVCAPAAKSSWQGTMLNAIYITGHNQSKRHPAPVHWQCCNIICTASQAIFRQAARQMLLTKITARMSPVMDIQMYCSVGLSAAEINTPL